MDGATPILEFQARFTAFVKKNDLLPSGGAVVVGVSGGADSICLLDLLRQIDARLHAVHVNYGFRGAESDGDESLVRDLCARWDVPLKVHRVLDAWRQDASSRSLQEAARDLRYEIMLDAAREIGARTVAVAHHQDDQAETMLLRLFRGTGAHGLAAMRVQRRLSELVTLVRPLLYVSRAEIEAYVALRELPFRDDRSNRDDRFDRVKVRHTVLPAIRQAFGESAVRNIAEAADRMREIVDDGIGPIIDADLAGIVDERIDCVHLDLEGLSRLPDGRRRLVLLRALQRYLPGAPQRATVIERTEDLMTGPPGRRLALDSCTVWRDRSSIVLVPERVEAAEDTLAILPDRTNATSYGRLTVERVDPATAELSENANTEIADGRVLDRPLTLGRWQPGERFQPLGFEGTKKISDFLTDAKVPTYLRRSTPVLRSGSEVVWIPGLRLAHPFRLTEASISAVRISFESSR
ncbi:MAG: tRNA lysidine(34) synthetase TilS [Rhodothermales bacterium]